MKRPNNPVSSYIRVNSVGKKHDGFSCILYILVYILYLMLRKRIRLDVILFVNSFETRPFLSIIVAWSKIIFEFSC